MSSRSRRLIRAALLLVLPFRIGRLVANLLGFRLARGSRIGWSWLAIDGLDMAAGARIGHFNRLSGPFAVRMGARSLVGNFNVATRFPTLGAGPAAELVIGQLAGVTSRHRLDLTASIVIGDFSTIAGNGSQLWTHGYVHDRTGPGRYRIDGPIEIGRNVYIGTMAFVSMGVRIADGVMVGGGTAVARSLIEPGLYVSAGLRHLPRPAHPDSRADLVAMNRAPPGDIVYRRVWADRAP